MKTAAVGLLIGLLALLSACQPASQDLVPTITPMPTPTATATIETEPTAVADDLATEAVTEEPTAEATRTATSEPTEELTTTATARGATAEATERATASEATDEAPSDTESPDEEATVDAALLEPGSFNIAISAENQDAAFDSTVSLASAQYLPGPSTTEIHFRLGQEGQVIAAQQISLALPGELEPGTYEITRDFATAAAIGETGAAYIDSTDPTRRTIYLNPSGTVTITAADADSVSGSFSFSVENPDGATARLSGSFHELPSESRSN